MYINPELNIINPSTDVLVLGVYMSSNCTFDFHGTDFILKMLKFEWMASQNI